MDTVWLSEHWKASRWVCFSLELVIDSHASRASQRIRGKCGQPAPNLKTASTHQSYMDKSNRLLRSVFVPFLKTKDAMGALKHMRSLTKDGAVFPGFVTDQLLHLSLTQDHTELRDEVFDHMKTHKLPYTEYTYTMQVRDKVDPEEAVSLLTVAAANRDELSNGMRNRMFHSAFDAILSEEDLVHFESIKTLYDQSEVLPSQSDYVSMLSAWARARGPASTLDQLLREICKNFPVIDAPLVAALESVAESSKYDFSRVVVDFNGTVTQEEGIRRLRRRELSRAEIATLLEKLTPEIEQGLERYCQRREPWDLVVDGLNLSRAIKYHGRVHDLIRNHDYSRILIVWRQDANQQELEVLKSVFEAAESVDVWTCVRGKRDDLASIYCSLYSQSLRGPSAGKTLSNDQFRDYAYAIFSPIKSLFDRWKNLHIIKFDLDQHCEFLLPPRYSTYSQRIGGSVWMLPLTPTDWVLLKDQAKISEKHKYYSFKQVLVPYLKAGDPEGALDKLQEFSDDGVVIPGDLVDQFLHLSQGRHWNRTRTLAQSRLYAAVLEYIAKYDIPYTLFTYTSLLRDGSRSPKDNLVMLREALGIFQHTGEVTNRLFTAAMDGMGAAGAQENLESLWGIYKVANMSPTQQEYCALIRAWKQCGGNATFIQTVLTEMMETEEFLLPETLKCIEECFSGIYRMERLLVNSQGVAKSTLLGQRVVLPTKSLTAEELTGLCNTLLEDQPGFSQEFLEYCELHRPWDVIMDGLNLSHYPVQVRTGVCRPQTTCDIVRDYVKVNPRKKVLLVWRGNGDAPELGQIEKEFPNVHIHERKGQGGVDDLWMIMAAWKSQLVDPSLKIQAISNDKLDNYAGGMFRDNRLFDRWRKLTLTSYTFNNSVLKLYPPRRYTIGLHKFNGYWVLPSRSPNKWLLIKM